MPDAAVMRQVVTDYVEAMNSGDRARYVSLFAPDATIEDPVGSDVRKGHDEIGAFWDLVHSLSSRITLVQTGPVRVAGRELAFPMQAVSEVDGAEMVVDIIDVFVVDDDGKIASMRAFWDPAEMRPR